LRSGEIFPAYRDAVRAGRWQTSPQPTLNHLPIEDLGGATLGLIGYGDLARGVEKLARAFGMDILIAERKGAAARAGRTAFEDVLRRSDVISLHAPMTDETRGFIGAKELALMKKSALLINAGRGGLVDEAALAEALKAGTVGRRRHRCPFAGAPTRWESAGGNSTCRTSS